MYKIKSILIDFLLGFCFRFLDTIYPKNNNYWGFSVHHIKSDQFVENARAIFEAVKKDSNLKKILFTRDNTTEFGIDNAVNYEIVKLYSRKGLLLFLKCRVLFVTHSLSMDYSYRYGDSQFSIIKLNLDRHILVNLWHGIPLKRLYAIANKKVREHLDRVAFRRYERRKYAGLIASSDIDSYAMSTIFHPIKYDNIWLTGLPRNDFLSMSDDKLPFYLKEQVRLIQELKKGKRLILYAPTYRQKKAVNTATYYHFSISEIERLKALLKKHHAVFAFRMHYFRSNDMFNMEDFIDGEYIIDLGHKVIPEIAPVIRESDIVITDYSSVFMEALYIDKPVYGFTYDFEHYKGEEEGLVYDYDFVFPGKQANDFNTLLAYLDEELKDSTQVNSEQYNTSKRVFYKYNDTNNANRVVTQVKNLINKNE